MLAIMALVLTSACEPAEEQAAGSVENRTAAERRELADLPRLTRRGIEYPYIRYSESTGRAESHGQIFYLYPMTRRTNQMVAVEYEPGAEVKGLVVEEILGSAGLVVAEGNNLRIDFMPISIPRGVVAGQTWPMRYAKRDFSCRSGASSGSAAGSPQIAVSCSEGKYVLRFLFDRERGVTEYQDFCDNSICTYRLTDPAGLLSRAALEHMGISPL